MTEGLLRSRVAAYGHAPAFRTLAVNILFQNDIQVCDLIMSGVLSTLSGDQVRLRGEWYRLDSLHARNDGLPVRG